MSARINYNRITGSNIQGDATTVTEPLGTLVVTNNGDLRLHDGSTVGGNSIGSGGSTGPVWQLTSGTAVISLDTDGVLTFSDNTVQTTAWTGTVAYSNVTGTPSIPSLGNFAFSGDTLSNTLSDGSTLQVGGNNWTFGSDGNLTLPGDLHGAEIFEPSPNDTISAGHQLNITPASNATDKKFEFAINQDSSGVFQNAALQLPTSENNKQVYLSFPGNDSGDSSSSIVSLWNQNTNSGPSDFNNAFNILANGKDIKLTAEARNGSYSTWTFDSSGNLTIPGEIKSEANTGPVIINSTDGNTTKTWTFGGDGSITFPDATVQTTAWTGTDTVTLNAVQTLTNKTLTSPTITDGVFQDTFSIGNQVFYEHGYNGFSVNENYDIVGEGNFTGYHYTSGAGRDGVAFTLARTGKFTTGFGIHGTAEANEYVIGSETANTDFVFKNNIGMPFDVSGGTELLRISNDGSVTFSDGTVQTTAYRVMSLPPLTAWGTVVSFDNLSFSFDATTGSPGFNGGYGQGSGSYSTLIWTADLYQQQASPTNLTISSGGPVQYFNYNGPNLITEVALTPGDSFVLRIQDVDTNRVYRATFLASFKAADAGNEGKYGAITVERLV